MTDEEIRAWDNYAPKTIEKRAELIAEHLNRTNPRQTTPKAIVQRCSAGSGLIAIFNLYSQAQKYFAAQGLM